jgi:peptide deformylase
LANVKRARRIQVQTQDRYGHTRPLEFEGFAAVVVQHELDHLKGVLMIDHIRSISRDLRPRSMAEVLHE